jgi:hypothetical protein
MKKHTLVLALVLISLGLVLITNSITSAQSANEFTVPLSDPSKRARLKAHLNVGSITVKGTGRKDVLVKYKESDNEGNEDEENENENENREHRDHNGKNVPDSKEGLRRIGGGGMDLEVTENNNNIKVESDSWNHRLNLEIEVPYGVDMEVNTYNDGDLMVSNVQGELALTNYNGEITALNISGSVVASTYNGEIKVTFDKVTEGTPMSYSTFNGDIDLTFPATIKASLKMKTEQGEIFTGFDFKIMSSGPVQKKDTQSGIFKVIIDDWKRGDINGGGPDITLKNYNGDIIIRKK